MTNLTTISELVSLNNIVPATVKYLLEKQNVSPVDKKRHVISGFSGYPYLATEANKALLPFIKSRQKSTVVLKKMSNEDICKVLRHYLKSNLWNKLISSWNFSDWEEFKKLEYEFKNNIEVIDPETVEADGEVNNTR